MKAASVIFGYKDYQELTGYEGLMEKVKSRLVLCGEQGMQIVVFPALLGCLFNNGEKYINDVIEQSNYHRGMAICPGSYYEEEAGNIYHSSCIIQDGQIKMKQRQLYLAKWEKKLGLLRGIELNNISLWGMKLGIMVSSDVFYPQVSRAFAMSGVELVIAPTAVKGKENMFRQLAGLWQNVQANLFFGLESGFKGGFKGYDFHGSSMIHAPLDMTEGEDGFLARESNDAGAAIITAELDNQRRLEAAKRFNTFAQLNREAYKDIFMLPQEVGRRE